MARNDLCQMQTVKVNESFQEEQTELSFAPGNKKQSLEVATDFDCSGADEFVGDAAKNSFISLFLSHLERNSTSESVDDILNSNEHFLPKVQDDVFNPDFSKNESRKFESRASDNSKLSPTMVHTDHRSDDKSLPIGSTGYISQDSPHANHQAYLIDGDCLSHLLPNQQKSGTSKMCKEVSCPSKFGTCDYVTDKSHQSAHKETGMTCLHDKMARQFHASDNVDDFCTHEKSRAFFGISCLYGRPCCPSAQELLPCFGPKDQSTLKKPIHGSCCKVNQDVCKLGLRARYLCRTCCSNDDGPILAHKPIVEGPDECCTCSTFIPRSSLCSRDHILQSPCHACPINELHHISSMGHSTNSLVKNSLFEVPNKKEPSSCWEARCRYSVIPNCLAGCAFTNNHDISIDQNSPILPTNKHDIRIPDNCCTLGESENLRFGPCQCQKNKIARANNSQTSFWTDVSSKATIYPALALSERVKNVSRALVAGGNQLDGFATEIEGAHRDSRIFKEQLKSGFSSGSSTAIVTNISMSTEPNNMASCTTQHTERRKNLVFDEGSRIEKSASSSYAPVSSECEQALSCFSKLHLNSAKAKRKCHQIPDRCILKENDKEKHLEMSKKTRTLRCSAKCSEQDNCTRKIGLLPSQKGEYQPEHGDSSFSSCREEKTKRKHPSMFLNKPVKRLRSHHKILKDDDGHSDGGDTLFGALSYSGRRRQVDDMDALDRAKHKKEGTCVIARKLPKYVSLSCIARETNTEDDCSGKMCGDTSLLATGIMNDNRKSPKIVSLSLILKKAKRCQIAKPVPKAGNASLPEEKSPGLSVNKTHFGVRSSRNSLFDIKDCDPQVGDESQPSEKNRYLADALKPCVEADCKSDCVLGENEPRVLADAKISQLPISSSRSPGVKNQSASLSLGRFRKYEDFTDGLASKPSGDNNTTTEVCQVNDGRNNIIDLLLNSDAYCCVCGSSDLEPYNQLIECSKCFIKVHQACYGVPKVPRGQWFCRPCKINAQDIVCVLCGYGGGAMTRALKAQNIVKSLLKGLTIEARQEKYVHSPENSGDGCTGRLFGEDIIHDSFYASRSLSSNTESKMNLPRPTDGSHQENIMSTFQTFTNQNSSLLGPLTMQWVHVVCGLWTPGTRCPKPNTMSAFDVSGASPAQKNIACSMCNRTGGSFMVCRDVNCSMFFHPWCAHQKGLLQSELEGEQCRKVGFYGRCLGHATLDYSSIGKHVDPEECLRSKDWTCARIEGFKGRKTENWSGANYKKSQENSEGCTVSQEQINAWLRINVSKSCGRGQKEYVHYKQFKRWRHLVVCKSGIHGLGLYTSQLIPRGAMVVEYVGEIVGQRVADKREIEYQSGRRQQYKSACYFFRIDKDHIIDATRKGGIARFVNHSCMPNCVAKVISVRNEKKVVFFAERHINPGEEITYDYHFNREDEGQRIPCFCRSKNCRRYLN